MNDSLKKWLVYAGYPLLIFSVILLSFFYPQFSINKQPSLKIFMFGDVLDVEKIYQFGRENNVKIYIKYAEFSEEMFGQLLASNGAHYDLVTPNDYMVKKLIEHNLISPLDKNTLNHSNAIGKEFYDYYEETLYSIPYSFNFYGIGYKKNSIDPKLLTLESLFEPTESALFNKIIVPDDPKILTTLTKLYLEAHAKEATLSAVYKLLIAQKKYVEAYTEANIQYILEKNISSRVIVNACLMSKIIEKNKNFGFIFPEEGTLLSVEHLVIPAKSLQKGLALKLIDYLISPEAQKDCFTNTGALPTNKFVYKALKKNPLYDYSYFPNKKELASMTRMNESYDEKKILKVWFKIQSYGIF